MNCTCLIKTCQLLPQLLPITCLTFTLVPCFSVPSPVAALSTVPWGDHSVRTWGTLPWVPGARDTPACDPMNEFMAKIFFCFFQLKRVDSVLMWGCPIPSCITNVCLSTQPPARKMKTVKVGRSAAVRDASTNAGTLWVSQPYLQNFE